jgi:hypothetical protein
MLNIYRGNHSTFISDMVSTVMQLTNDYIVTDKLDNSKINVVFDNFATNESLEIIKEFKIKNPDSVIIFIGTEFVEKIDNIYTFNITNVEIQKYFLRIFHLKKKKNYIKLLSFFTCNFLKKEIYKILLIVFIYLIKKYLIDKIALWLRKFNNFFNDRLLGLQNFFETFLNNFLSSSITYKSIYNHYRFVGFKEAIKYCDYLMLVHDGQISNYKKLTSLKFIGIIYPKLDINKKNLQKILTKNPKSVILTGTLSKYRKKMLDLLIENVKKKYNFKMDVVIKRSIDQNDSMFSFHPKQSYHWKYSSPLRIYRSIIYQNTIPLSSESFAQHPIDSLLIEPCLDEFSMIIDKQNNKFINYYMNKITEYNKVIDLRNKKITKFLNEFKKKSH